MRKFTFSKRERIRKGNHFSQIKKRGNVFKTRKLIFNYVEDCENSKLGIIVTKKVGNAVFRNSVRRWIKEIFRINRFNLSSALEIIIIPRTSAITFNELKRDFLYFVGWHNEKTNN